MFALHMYGGMAAWRAANERGEPGESRAAGVEFFTVLRMLCRSTRARLQASCCKTAVMPHATAHPAHSARLDGADDPAVAHVDRWVAVLIDRR